MRINAFCTLRRQTSGRCHGRLRARLLLQFFGSGRAVCMMARCIAGHTHDTGATSTNLAAPAFSQAHSKSSRALTALPARRPIV